MTSPTGDRGSGTVLVLALCGLMCSAVLALGLLASAAAARHRAQTAADLAALAAADVALGRRAGQPCELGARVARANGGQLVACVVAADGSAQVSVAVRPAGPVATLGAARAAARAGPRPP